MYRERLRKEWEIIEGEHLKTASEIALNGLASNQFGEYALRIIQGGERIEDPRLHTEIAGISLENPVMVGAGWDKRGRCIDGLYRLGFSGVEVGSVLVFPQYGNPRPRLFTDKETHSVGLNRLGFNAPGVEVVENNLRN